MKLIPLGQGKFAQVDDEDYQSLMEYRWYTNSRGYASNNKLGLMHRVVMPVSAGVQIDHIDRTPLNNQKSNLRLATAAQNQCNVGLRRDNTSGYKGVTRQNGRWVASIRFNSRRLYLGMYPTAELAYAAYLKRARELQGGFMAL